MDTRSEAESLPVEDIPVVFVHTNDGKEILRTEVPGRKVIEAGLPVHVKVITILDGFVEPTEQALLDYVRANPVNVPEQPEGTDWFVAEGGAPS